MCFYTASLWLGRRSALFSVCARGIAKFGAFFRARGIAKRLANTKNMSERLRVGRGASGCCEKNDNTHFLIVSWGA